MLTSDLHMYLHTQVNINIHIHHIAIYKNKYLRKYKNMKHLAKKSDQMCVSTEHTRNSVSVRSQYIRVQSPSMHSTPIAGLGSQQQRDEGQGDPTKGLLSAPGPATLPLFPDLLLNYFCYAKEGAGNCFNYNHVLLCLYKFMKTQANIQSNHHLNQILCVRKFTQTHMHNQQIP